MSRNNQRKQSRQQKRKEKRHTDGTKQKDFREHIRYLTSHALQSHNELTDKWHYVTTIEEYVKSKLQNVSFSQVRNLFDTIQKINEVIMLPDIDYKLKYIVGRSGTDQGVKFLLQDLIIPLLVQVDNEKKLKQYKEFLTALLCYHKFYAKKK